MKPNAMHADIAQTAFVRRTDVMLRAQYPHLITRIFQITHDSFAIVFPTELQDAKDIAQHFNDAIRPVTVPVTVSNTIPQNPIREIQPIPDSAIAEGFEGYSFSAFDLANYFASRYPSLPGLRSVRSDSYPTLTLTFSQVLSGSEDATVRSVIASLMPDWPLKIAVADVDAAQGPHDPLRIVAAKLRQDAPKFVRQDEEYFWRHIDPIFEGRMTSRDHPAMTSSGMACYVDASVHPQIDLRQLLLLYDTIFLSPPLEDSPQNPFWQSQAATKADLLHVIEARRLRLVLRQPEERCDLRWLEEVHERSSHAIVGRLSAGALLAADLVTTANSYTLARPEHRSAVATLARALAAEFGVPERDTRELLLWPVGARLMSPQLVLDRGLMGMPSLGLGNLLAKQIERDTGKDARLEAIVAADGIHIAHLLGATLIPPRDGLQDWLPARKALAARLNFYRNFNSHVAAAWASNERRKEARLSLLPPLPLFNFGKHASIDDILALSAATSIRFSGRALVSRLAEMPDHERVEEINRLEKELYTHQISRERRNLNLDTADAAVGVANDLLSIGLLPVMSGLKLVHRIIKLARHNGAFDSFADELERSIGGHFGRNADIDFLDKVSRVAALESDAA